MNQETAFVTISDRIMWYYCPGKDLPVWVGVCDSLSITSQGDTEQELIEDMQSLPNELFQDLLESNDLEKFMEERRLDVNQIKGLKSGASFSFPNMTMRKVDQIITGI